MSKINFFIRQLYCLDDVGRNKGIEGLRALAVLMVFNTHSLSYFYFDNFYVSDSPIILGLLKFLQSGHFGVDIFFVISGYLIYKTTLQSLPTFINFFQRRFMRLMPAHIAVLIYVTPSNFLWSNFIENIFFLPAFVKSIPSYNFITWSLGWEWSFYIAFFCLFKIFKNYSKIYAILGGALIIATLFICTSPDTSLAAYIKHNYEVPIPGRFCGFFIGIAIANILERYQYKSSNRFFKISGNIGVVGLVLWIWVYSCYREDNIFKSYNAVNLYFIVFDLLSAFIIVGLVRGENNSIINNLFSSTPLRLLGQISYSFYLVHVSVGIQLTQKIIIAQSFSQIIYFYIVSFFISFFAASILFLIFERFFMSTSKKLLRFA